MLHRLLPLLIIVSLLVLVSINFTQIKRDIVYRLGISGDTTKSCCDADKVAHSSGNFDPSATTAVFMGEVIDYPKTSLEQAYMQSVQLANQGNPDERILGTTTATGEEKWIEVSVEDQRVRAWEGERLVMEFPVSTGRWAPTPKGTYHIWYKTRNQLMSGGAKELGTYYYLPNVPNNMFFYQGYALHGAYWHNNFGKPMSHGCVNEPLANAAQIFEWAGPVVPDGKNVVRATAENPGTRVFVH